MAVSDRALMWQLDGADRVVVGQSWSRQAEDINCSNAGHPMASTCCPKFSILEFDSRSADLWRTAHEDYKMVIDQW